MTGPQTTGCVLEEEKLKILREGEMVSDADQYNRVVAEFPTNPE